MRLLEACTDYKTKIMLIFKKKKKEACNQYKQAKLTEEITWGNIRKVLLRKIYVLTMQRFFLCVVCVFCCVCVCVFTLCPQINKAG